MNLKGYRKLLVTVLVILAGTGLVVFGKISADNFVDMTKWVAGLFLGFNATEAVGTKLAEKKKLDVKLTDAH